MEEQEIKTTICPLKPPAQYDPETGKTIYFKCEREVCEWWVKNQECCAVILIADALMQIEKEIRQ